MAKNRTKQRAKAEPKKRGRKTNVTATIDARTVPGLLSDGAARPTAASGKKGKQKAAVAIDANDMPTATEATTTASSNPTLADAFTGYMKSLEVEGKSIGTIASYRMELITASSVLDVATPLAEITSDHVLAFFTSKQVTRKRDGSPKSPLSIDKTRRVLRQALVWAETAGLVTVAPVPEMLATH